jgi:hypothetical protein
VCVYGHAEESGFQSTDRYGYGERHDIEQLRVDGNAIRTLDHDYQRFEWQRQRKRSLPGVGQHRIVVSNRDVDGGRAASDPHASGSDGSEYARRPPHH